MDKPVKVTQITCSSVEHPCATFTGFIYKVYVFDFVADETMRLLYHELLQRVRKGYSV